MYVLKQDIAKASLTDFPFIIMKMMMQKKMLLNICVSKSDVVKILQA